MPRHCHIITVKPREELFSSENKGIVSVYPHITKNIGTTIRMNWDILADIARVKKDDYIFLHSEGLIKGVYKVIDNPFILNKYKSFLNGPNIVIKKWEKEESKIKKYLKNSDVCWMIPFIPVKGLLFNPMKMEYIFESMARGEIKSLPPRLRYEDKNKTVKGLIENDFNIIVELLYNFSQPASAKLIKHYYPMKKIYIQFDYFTEDGYEKNLEAIIID